MSQATGSGTATNTITLSFTPPSGQDGLTPQLYKVWRTAAGGASGSETFLGYVDSTVGLAADNVTPILTNQIVDTGAALVPQQSSGSVVPSTLPTAYYGTSTAMLPPAAGPGEHLPDQPGQGQRRPPVGARGAARWTSTRPRRARTRCLTQ